MNHGGRKRDENVEKLHEPLKKVANSMYSYPNWSKSWAGKQRTHLECMLLKNVLQSAIVLDLWPGIKIRCGPFSDTFEKPCSSINSDCPDSDPTCNGIGPAQIRKDRMSCDSGCLHCHEKIIYEQKQKSELGHFCLQSKRSLRAPNCFIFCHYTVMHYSLSLSGVASSIQQIQADSGHR